MHGLHARRAVLRLILMLGLSSAAVAGDTVALPTAARPLLVELFTSQGCSSCPPADAALGELARRPDVLALAYHVDYWDGLGWKDAYSSPQATRRQHDYARASGFQVYTPQLVVDGQRAVVGSNRDATALALQAARGAATSVSAALHRAGDQLTIQLGATKDPQGRGNVYLLSYQPSGTTDIERGENAGRRITYTNLVRSIRHVGDWRGEALTIAELLHADEQQPRLAVIVQDESGKVWAVASADSR